MVINLECPWCDERVAVAREDLDGDIACESCGVTFVVVDDAVELAAAA
jgi:uncharacterized protein YbaR (Trm112 family)